MSAHVAVFAHDLAANGVARNGIAVATHLAKNGIRTDLVVADARGVFAAEPLGAARLFALEAFAPGASRARQVLGTALALRAYLEREKPALLLSMGNHGHFAAWLGARGFGCARVYRISNALARGSWLRRGVRSATLALIARDARRLVLVAPTLLAGEEIGRAFGAGRVRVIPNGVDLAGARRLASAACPHPWLGEAIPVVLAIGRLHAQKNFAALVRAFARVRAARPARLVVLGSGPEANRRALIDLASELGVADAVDLPGSVENPCAHLARAAAFALPSRWEGSSNALLEALACGTPIVASRSAGDAVSILGDGEFGILFDVDDEASFAAALLRQLSPDAVRPGHRASRYDLAATLAAYEACVREVLSIDRSSHVLPERSGKTRTADAVRVT